MLELEQEVGCTAAKLQVLLASKIVVLKASRLLALAALEAAVTSSQGLARAS